MVDFDSNDVEKAPSLPLDLIACRQLHPQV